MSANQNPKTDLSLFGIIYKKMYNIMKTLWTGSLQMHTTSTPNI